MYTLIYVSVLKDYQRVPANTILLDILESSRRNNKAKGITGMLLYKYGSFLQVLEGEEEVVKSAFEIITQDPRSTAVSVVYQSKIKDREFPGWSMAFRNIELNESDSPEGYSDYLNVSFTKAEFLNNPSLSLELIKMFKSEG